MLVERKFDAIADGDSSTSISIPDNETVTINFRHNIWLLETIIRFEGQTNNVIVEAKKQDCEPIGDRAAYKAVHIFNCSSRGTIGFITLVPQKDVVISEVDFLLQIGTKNNCSYPDSKFILLILRRKPTS